MTTPSKIAVFLAVLTGHLAVLAIAFPTLDPQMPTAEHEISSENPGEAHAHTARPDTSTAAEATDSHGQQRVNQQSPTPIGKSRTDREETPHAPNLAQAENFSQLFDAAPSPTLDPIELERKVGPLLPIPGVKKDTMASVTISPRLVAAVHKENSAAAVKETPAATRPTNKETPAVESEPSPTVMPSTIPLTLNRPVKKSESPAVRPAPEKAGAVPASGNRPAGAGRMSNLRPLSVPN